MSKENTSVYVPIETPDHKSWATLLAMLVHLGVLGFIIYTNHAKPLNDTPIEMSLVTPEQLAMIQGQATANQQDQASANSSNSNVTAKSNPNSSTNPAVVAYNNDLAARQAKWQKEQQAYASQLDKEAQAEQDKFANQLTEDRQKQIDNLDDLRDKMAHPEVSPPLTPTKMPKTNRVSGSFPTAGATGEGSNTYSSDDKGKNANKGVSVGQYRNQILDIINANWSPPQNSNGNSLVVHFKISPAGDISIMEITGGNNEAYKSSLVQALNASSPLPPPPPEHYSDFADNKFTFNAHKK